MKRVSYFIAAKDQWHDQSAADLMLALKEKLPGVSAWGIGGPAMQRAGMQAFAGAKNLQTIAADAVEWQQFLSILDRQQPKVAILTPGCERDCLLEAFDLRQIPIVWYGAPEKYFETKYSSTASLVCGFYRFQQSWFTGHRMRFHYVGNPVRDRIAKIHVDSETLAIKAAGEMWLTFRCPDNATDFRNCFPFFWRIALAFAHRNSSWRVWILMSEQHRDEALRLGGKLLENAVNEQAQVRVSFDMLLERLKLSDLAVTATDLDSLETAFLEVLSVATTGQSSSFLLGLSSSHSLTNFLGQNSIIPEQQLNNEEGVLETLLNLSHESDQRLQIKQQLSQLKRATEGFAAETAAQIVKPLLSSVRRS